MSKTFRLAKLAQEVVEGTKGFQCDLRYGTRTAGNKGTIDRYIGYFELYATSHAALDEDKAVQEEGEEQVCPSSSTTVRSQFSLVSPNKTFTTRLICKTKATSFRVLSFIKQPFPMSGFDR